MFNVEFDFWELISISCSLHFVADWCMRQSHWHYKNIVVDIQICWQKSATATKWHTNKFSAVMSRSESLSIHPPDFSIDRTSDSLVFSLMNSPTKSWNCEKCTFQGLNSNHEKYSWKLNVQWWTSVAFRCHHSVQFILCKSTKNRSNK